MDNQVPQKSRHKSQPAKYSPCQPVGPDFRCNAMGCQVQLPCLTTGAEIDDCGRFDAAEQPKHNPEHDFEPEDNTHESTRLVLRHGGNGF